MQPIVPFLKSNPAVLFPFSISTFRAYTNAEESYPPLSARMVGIYLKALAYASIANADFPFSFLASLSNALAIYISTCPPP